MCMCVCVCVCMCVCVLSVTIDSHVISCDPAHTQVGSYRLDSQGKMPGAKKVSVIMHCHGDGTANHILPQ